ncbi:hypothetical protein COOONC_11931 [Cooperia oncophora]
MSGSGDITQKGYEKKRNLLLAKYSKGCSAGPGQSKSSPGSRAHRQHQRRLTRDESRFHSEIRAEAVQQALAEYSQGYKVRPSIVQPIKRPSESRKRFSRASDSSSDDDDSLVGSLKRKTPGKQNTGLGTFIVFLINFTGVLGKLRVSMLARDIFCALML